MVKNPRAMRETWVWSLGWEDPLEEEMLTHSSILARRITMDRGTWRAVVHRVARVGHNWLTKHKHRHDAGDAGDGGLTHSGDRRKYQPTPVFLPGKSHGQRGLAGCSPWGLKELDTAKWHIYVNTKLPIYPFLSLPFGNHKFGFVVYIFKNCHAMKYCIFTWTQTIFLRLQASHGLQSFSLFVSKIKDYPTVHKQSRLSF